MTSDKSQISLYNTLTRRKETFAPIDADNVRMYVCGPTVYDYAHIGNARPVIVFDVLFRLLRHVHGADHVTYVRNITDVDDKINARAARDYPDLPLNDAIRAVTEKTADQFNRDAKALGCLEPTFQPRATDNIDEMKAIISTLIEKNHAYEAGGEVLFDVHSMPDYGALSGRNLEDQLAGARVAVDAHKHNPADFVLWKQSSADEPGWESPWGRGRPGWHIECSAMSERYLGQTFDIHGGGLDLIFPHHENEIAQSRCAHGTHAMANIWMHNGFLQVEGQKMSKSLGNFVTINELLETEKFGGRKWPGEVLRLAMLMTHYRQPIDFSVSRLEEASSHIRNWGSVLEKLKLTSLDQVDMEQIPEGLIDALGDDLNTSEAVRRLTGNLRWRFAMKDWEPVPVNIMPLAAALRLLGFDALLESTFFSADDNAEAPWKSKVEARLAALNAKDFATADRIRNELAEQGIALMDYKDPETGERRTKWEVKR
jgi:cysteinyl-tRNA synthetase